MSQLEDIEAAWDAIKARQRQLHENLRTAETAAPVERRVVDAGDSAAPYRGPEAFLGRWAAERAAQTDKREAEAPVERREPLVVTYHDGSGWVPAESYRKLLEDFEKLRRWRVAGGPQKLVDAMQGLYEAGDPAKQPKEGVTAKFGTGAVRSDTFEEFRYDLISPIGLREVARTCAEGAQKYSDYNWEKGMPVHDLLNHAIAHCYAFLSGDRSEPHLGHAAWNLLAAIHSHELWHELNEGHLRGPGCKAPVPTQAQ